MTDQRNWDMYDYILEAGEAVRNIVKDEDQILKEALDYSGTGDLDQIYIVGSGTSYHAGLAAKRVFEKILKIRTDCEYALEFVDNVELFTRNALVIGISQAGRSSSTIAALDKARMNHLKTIAITAELDHPLKDHADVTIPLAIGPEYAGPKTKGFIGTIATLDLLALNLAVRRKTITENEKQSFIARMLATTDHIPDIADKASEWYKANKKDLIQCRRMIVLGYGPNIGAMKEGTLKLFEAVRYSVTGYETEEFMHGGYHSVNDGTWIISLCFPDYHMERAVRMNEYFTQHRHAHCYCVSSQKINHSDFCYPFADDELFAAMEYVVVLQVLARRMSQDLGIDCNVSEDPDFHRFMGSYTY